MTERTDDVVITVAVPDWAEQGIFRDFIPVECSDAQEEVSTCGGENDHDSVVEENQEYHFEHHAENPIELEYYPGNTPLANYTDAIGKKTRKKKMQFECPLCDFNDTKRVNFERHIRCHTGERPYCCTFCGRNFSTKGVLDMHVRTHTKQYPYFCCKCGKSFIGNTACVKHQKMVHGMVGKAVNMMYLKEEVSHMGEEQLIIRVKRNGHLYHGKFRLIQDHRSDS